MTMQSAESATGLVAREMPVHPKSSSDYGSHLWACQLGKHVHETHMHPKPSGGKEPCKVSVFHLIGHGPDWATAAANARK